MSFNTFPTRQDITHPAADQRGFVLIIAMVALVLLSLMGMAASRNTTVELQIAGNDKIYLTDFYQSEAAAYEAAQRLEQENKYNLQNNMLDVSDLNSTAPGIIRSDKIATTLNVEEYDPTETEDVEKLLETNTISVTSLNGGNFVAVDKGVPRGASLNMTTSSQIHGYDVFGYSAQKNSKTVVRIGYRKRY